MLYKELTIGDKEYKLVLNASASVMAEQKLGENPINFLVEIAENGKMPSIEKLMIILWASLQKYQHGIKLEDAYNIYDEYIEEGHQLADILPVMMDVFEVSGYFKKSNVGDAEKNVKKASK